MERKGQVFHPNSKEDWNILCLIPFCSLYQDKITEKVVLASISWKVPILYPLTMKT